MEKLVNTPSRSLSERAFNLEYKVVSPLYYRLEKHLIDWGASDHPIQATEFAQYRKANHVTFKDIPPLKLYDGNLHQLEPSQGTGHNTDRD